MSTQNNATIYVVNNLGGSANISFSHQYTGETAQTFTSPGPVPSGGVTGPLTVTFWTGSLGTDYWYCTATAIDGPNMGQTFSTEGTLTDPTKECMCQSQDSGAVYFFPFSVGGFVMTLLSGPCSTGVST